VVTLNVATSLKASVVIEEVANLKDDIHIHSIDYKFEKSFQRKHLTKENLANGFFGNMTFLMEILKEWQVYRGIKLTLSSGSPPGAGLGGSSAMGVTVASALCDYTRKKMPVTDIIKKVNQIEGKILQSGPPGYQDYYPALYGGILALQPNLLEIAVHQLYTPALKDYLQEHCTLVYSGQTRLSGINNWQVYKGFFDRVGGIREGLEEIAKISHLAYQCIKDRAYQQLIQHISDEGALRKKLFSGITTNDMDQLFEKLKQVIPTIGMKVCGAGGGGCFLLLHPADKKNTVHEMVISSDMKILEFSIEKPL